jgi:protein-L-isoaspartate(D-aspartate) O-methyltransferase
MNCLADVATMVDFASARKAMVESQLRASGVSDRRLLAVMGRLPRELFLPEERRDLAYIDDIHLLGPAGSGHFLADPATFARLVQLAAVTEHDEVLDIGVATGYSTAAFAQLARRVVGLERNKLLAATARRNLESLTIHNAEIVEHASAFDGARFDVILMEGAVTAIPDDTTALLRLGGRLVALVRQGATGTATLVHASDGEISRTVHFNASLPLLDVPSEPAPFVF